MTNMRIGLFLAVSTLAGCNLFRPGTSEVQGTSKQAPAPGGQDQQQKPGGYVNPCGGVVKVLSTKDSYGKWSEALGIWRMPHSGQGNYPYAINLDKVTVAVIQQPNTAPVVYFKNGKMPDGLSEQQQIAWLTDKPQGMLTVQGKQGLQGCPTASALNFLGSHEVGCFDVDACQMVWVGDLNANCKKFQTNCKEVNPDCEIDSKDNMFNEEEFIHCGELKLAPGAVPAGPQ